MDSRKESSKPQGKSHSRADSSSQSHHHHARSTSSIHPHHHNQHMRADSPVSMDEVTSALIEEFSKDELQAYAGMKYSLVKVEGGQDDMKDLRSSLSTNNDFGDEDPSRSSMSTLDTGLSESSGMAKKLKKKKKKDKRKPKTGANTANISQATSKQLDDTEEEEEEEDEEEQLSAEEEDNTESSIRKLKEEYVLPPECCADAPRTSRIEDFNGGNMDMIWFSKIKLDERMIKKLCFSESLLIVQDDGSVTGKVYIHVTPAKWGEEPCLCVHSGSYATFHKNIPGQEVQAGTSITAFVSMQLKCIHEYVHEWAKKGDITRERKVYLSKEDTILHCKLQTIENCETIAQKVVTVGMTEHLYLITEGVNIVFLRFITHQRKSGGIELLSMARSGKIVKMKYSELGRDYETVRGESVKTWTYRRTLMLPQGNVIWDHVLNGHGRLVLRCQPDNGYAYIPLWFEPVIEFDNNGVFTGIYPPFMWACDAELYAKYLVKKEELFFRKRTYLQDHPEIRALLADFMQSIMQRKPEQILPFAIQYFHSWLPIQMEQQSSSSGASTSDDSYSSIDMDGESGLDGEGGDFKWIMPIRESMLDERYEILPGEDNNLSSASSKATSKLRSFSKLSLPSKVDMDGESKMDVDADPSMLKKSAVDEP